VLLLSPIGWELVKLRERREKKGKERKGTHLEQRSVRGLALAGGCVLMNIWAATRVPNNIFEIRSFEWVSERLCKEVYVSVVVVFEADSSGGMAGVG
jgi:hypothetical protein